MARRGKVSKDKRSKPKQPAKLVDPPKKSKRFITCGLSVVTIAALIGTIVVTSIDGKGGELTFDSPPIVNRQAQVLPAVNKTKVNTDFELEPKTLNELANYYNSDFEKVDIARVNLLCASNLPTTEGLNIEHALSVLDEWAEKVAFETDRHLYRVHDPRPIYRERYNGSEAHMRAEFLAQVLHEDLGVKYDKTAIGSFSFADPSVAFIHGMIPGPGQTTADTPRGTCTSMPVLYVAVGRRLGYPLTLVNTDSHLFARWDGEALYGKKGGHSNPAWRETFNCETTSSFDKYDDAFYKKWPVPVTDEQIARNGYLKSLTAVEVYAQFLASRGHHGKDVKEYDFAARCFDNAHRRDPSRPCYVGWFLDVAVPCGYTTNTPRLQNELAMKRAEIENNKRQAKMMKQVDHLNGLPKIPKIDHQKAYREYIRQTSPIHKQGLQTTNNNIGQDSTWPGQQPYNPNEPFQANPTGP